QRSETSGIERHDQFSPHPIAQALEASSETGANDSSEFLAGSFARLHLGGGAHGSLW
ncbi:hypothetical protein E4U23_006689, partial [Claviceps purpurea]